MTLSVQQASELNASNLPASAAMGSLNGRLVVNADYDFIEDLGQFFLSVAKGISDFFYHRFADAYMFGAAFFSMGFGTTTADIARRMQEVQNFSEAVRAINFNQRTEQDHDRLLTDFRYLPLEIIQLFFYTGFSTIDFLACNDLDQFTNARDEILRECEQVISFQDTLALVNDFYRLFKCTCEPTEYRYPSYSEHPESRYPSYSEHPVREQGDVTPSVSVNDQGVERINDVIVSIPGTIAYVRDGIPQDVQQKAREIERLSERYDRLANRPTAPNHYSCGIMQVGFMSIPVFDASHPGIQVAARAANVPGAADDAANALNNRGLRHIYDKDNFERILNKIDEYGQRIPAECPACRHPDPNTLHPRRPTLIWGELNRVYKIEEYHAELRHYLRIDTALQDEILAFLRNAVQA